MDFKPAITKAPGSLNVKLGLFLVKRRIQKQCFFFLIYEGVGLAGGPEAQECLCSPSKQASLF